MRIPQPPEPSPLVAFFAAPLITPIFAIPLVALIPAIYASELDLLITLPVVAIVSLIYGYVGMVLICLPVIVVLHFMKKLNALTLCTAATLLGGIAWALLFHDLPSSALPTGYVRSFLVGAGCSLGVSGFFCLLSGITIRSSRARFAVSAKRLP